MLSGAFPQEVREHARLLMGNIVTMETFDQRRAERRAGNPPGAPGGLRDLDTSRTMLRPVYRTLGPGEQHSEGVLEQIECARGAVIMHVRSGDRTLRFHAQKLDEIEFITYRDDLSGAVTCGARVPPDPVYVTWRAGDATPLAARGPDGRIVAIEFVPK
jgi:hypothetical protein